MKRNIPPLSKRYCLNCERYRDFKYNRMTGHSKCTRCDSNCSKRFSPEDRIKRYCKKNNIPYEEPKKEVKTKIIKTEPDKKFKVWSSRSSRQHRKYLKEKKDKEFAEIQIKSPTGLTPFKLRKLKKA